MMNILTTGFAALMMALWAPTAATAEAPTPTGDWIGIIKTPQGEMRLLLTITEGKEKSLTAVLESVDQAPGQKIPVTTVSVEGDTLTFASRPIGASYQGTWNDETAAWEGNWSQGMQLPLSFKRGEIAASPVIEGLDGSWHATLKRGAQEIPLRLHLKTGEKGTAVTFDFPNQMAVGIPVSGFTRDGDTVSFQVKAAAVTYSGELKDSATRMEGTWSRPGMEDTTLAFTRQAEKTAAASRPQHPKEPFGYEARDVSIPNPAAEGVTLAGTLTLPNGKGPFPAAVLISGSGPQDRDETLMGHKPFAVLADHLTKQGIAVLRYDDRGFGKSTGDFGSATSADFATDANAAARFLMARADIRKDAVGFIGHSEGGMIAPIAAADNKDIAFAVLLAAPGTDIIELSLTQRLLIGRTQGISDDRLFAAINMLRPVYEAIAATKTEEEALAALNQMMTPASWAAIGVPEAQISTMAKQFVSPWHRYFLGYDPADWLPNLKGPVLALGGTLDLQVATEDNIGGMQEIFKHHPDFTAQKLEGLNHMFQTAKTGAIGEFAEIEETFAPIALSLISNWITARFPAAE